MTTLNVSSLFGQMRISTFTSPDSRSISTKRLKKPYLETSQSCMTPWRWRSQGAKMFDNESDEDERLIAREHKGTVATFLFAWFLLVLPTLEPLNTEYDVGEQLPVFPVAMKTGTLHSGLGKRTESGDSGISVNFSTATPEEVQVKVQTKERYASHRPHLLICLLFIAQSKSVSTRANIQRDSAMSSHRTSSTIMKRHHRGGRRQRVSNSS